MKVLITTDWYKPVINGVVTSVCNLANGLEEAGHEVRIATLSDSIHSHKEGNIYYFGSVSVDVIYPSARLKMSRAKEYIRELSQWHPDVIHSQCEFSTFRIARSVAGRTGAPIVHTYHTVYEGYTHYFFPNKKAGKSMVKAFSRHIAKKTDAMIVPSEKIETLLEDYRIHTPIHVIPSGIELDIYEKEHLEERRRIRAAYGFSQEECLLISVGRLAKEKNLQEILRYLAEESICSATSNASALSRQDAVIQEEIAMEEPRKLHNLLIVGDGPYREELENLARELGLEERVRFVGAVPPEEVATYYGVGDVFVSASTSETQGLTYMEAMASGCTMLCREDPCLEHLIEQGVNGYTYRDKEDFMWILAELSDDKRKRAQLGAAAQQQVEEIYSIDTFAKACEQVYEACVDD